MQAEIEALNAQIAGLKANPVTVTDEAALSDLKADVYKRQALRALHRRLCGWRESPWKRPPTIRRAE